MQTPSATRSTPTVGWGATAHNTHPNSTEQNRTEQHLRKVTPPHQYTFTHSKVFNLQANATITDHGDVANPAVAQALRDVLRVH